MNCEPCACGGREVAATHVCRLEGTTIELLVCQACVELPNGFRAATNARFVLLEPRPTPCTPEPHP